MQLVNYLLSDWLGRKPTNRCQKNRKEEGADIFGE